VAVDAFVHHYGGRTFVGSGVDCRALMAENQRRFREKWDHAGVDRRRTGIALAPSPVGESRGEGSEVPKAADAGVLLPFIRSAESVAVLGSRTLTPALSREEREPVFRGTMLLTSTSEPAPSDHTVASDRSADLALELAPGGGLRLRRAGNRPFLSLCMIVR